MVNLNRLLSKSKETYPLLLELILTLDETFKVLDADGVSLIEVGEEETPATHTRFPLTHTGDLLGCVIHGPRGEPVARLLAHLIQAEASRRTLGAEVLERYRELNLLYNLAEKLGASLELHVVAETALEEASRLIDAKHGALLLFSEGSRCLSVAAAFGEAWKTGEGAWLNAGILVTMAEAGKAEIVNNVRADIRRSENDVQAQSLICAPLKGKDGPIGLLLLCSQAENAYTAGDLKLLNTVAVQTAPSIENAILYERKLREARERESQLKRQVEALRIELDEARQAKKVAEITESEYFQRLRGQADVLRSIVDDAEG